MRPYPDAGRGILLRYIGKQKQHKQSPPVRPDIDAPIGVRICALRCRETRVNVSTCVARIVAVWKTDHEPPKALEGNPSTLTNQFVECGV